MAFVNEIVSEDDIENYALDGLMKEFRQRTWRDGRPDTFKHAWTIDRDRGIYFLPVKSIEEVGQSGRLQPTTKTVFVLNFQGKRVQATLDHVSGTSRTFAESPFRIVWDLLELDASQLSAVPESAVIQVLKEALAAYGQMGAHFQVPNTVVEFVF